MTTWREERRQDRANEEKIARDAETERVKNRITARKAARDARDRRRTARAARRSAALRWCAGHMTDLLFIPVIVVPGILAWAAMAAYGREVWGPLGIILPAFSEGAMWVFDAAVTIRRRRDPGAPVWHLQIGIVVSAAFGAGLNYLHGIAPATPHHGPVTAVSMALVSVAGVTAHQLITAGPRRSRAERYRARAAGLAERRARAAERAATKRAKFDLDGSGSTRPVYESGLATLTRRWGRLTLVVEPVKPQASVQIDGSRELPAEPPSPAPAEPAAGAHESAPDGPSSSARVEPPVNPPDEPAAAVPAEPADAPRQARRRPPARAPKPKTDTVTALIKAGVSNSEIVRRTGLSLATVKRRRSALKAAAGNVVPISRRA